MGELMPALFDQVVYRRQTDNPVARVRSQDDTLPLLRQRDLQDYFVMFPVALIQMHSDHLTTGKIRATVCDLVRAGKAPEHVLHGDAGGFHDNHIASIRMISGISV
jgi:hypothetical protein